MRRRFDSGNQRQRDTTPNLVEAFQRPHLSQIRPNEGFAARGLSARGDVSHFFDRPYHYERPSPLPPIQLVADRVTPLAEQVEEMVDRGVLQIYPGCMNLIRDLPPVESAENPPRMLGQHGFARSLVMFETIGTLPLPAGAVLADAFQYCAYLRRYLTVGLACEFCAGVPCSDGKTWLSVKRFKGEKVRRMHLHKSNARAQRGALYLVDFGPA